MAQNCWEFKNCGREPRGKNVALLGVCPASTEAKTSGLNNGKNGGRACWVIAGTFCGGEVQGSFVEKIENCSKCDFFLAVRKEEDKNYVPTPSILKVLRS